ncbi:Ceramidase [Metarhizium album ARSEF 1941]|uniref:Ceramidase n=1 Tax=Metarhizium album (strain ARSEF 1941) TaxID=1081103 RepID=A0A0B2WS41_METAS|nr:Ceramidase [Metarhizium album ARSEF 1941]KHN96838.1 Ceramidase [Metarhizium album ARSEF 1941]
MGHHNIRFNGDAHSLHGAWSPPTSRANFCEEDYAVTLYVAELVNSLTNLAYVHLALRSMYGPGNGGLFAPNADFMSVSLLGLGLGSFLFHASLRQTLEFADEFSMLGLTWAMLQATLTTRQSPTRSHVISTVLAVFFTSFAVFYLRSPSIIYQVIAFVGCLLLVIVANQYLLHWSWPALPQAKRRDWNRRTWRAVFISALGYVLWNIDLEYCAALRNIRRQVGLPWAWLFELHGWWHVLTAIGAAQFMDVAREVRRETKREHKRE